MSRSHTRLAWVALVVVVVGALVVASARGGDESETARVERLTDRLRCPECQGSSVADSDVATSRAITTLVAELVADGRSDSEIFGAVKARYGSEILLLPESSGVGLLVWLLPLVFGLLALGGLGLAFFRWRRVPSPPPSEADRALVDRYRFQRTCAGPTPSTPSTPSVPEPEEVPR